MRARRAHADEPLPLVHPLYVHLPDAPEDDALRRAFTAAAGRYRLHPVEVVDVPTPPAPRAPEWLRAGVLNTQKIAFGEALHDLDAAAVEVSTTGGAGLSTDELSDLYLNRAIATAHADWNATADAPPNEARTRAYADYLRAATIAPARTLNTRETPPQALADFARAVAEIRQRPRGSLTVSGSADAQVSLDGGPTMPVAGGLVLRDLVAGEHLIRVEELGHAGWGTVVAFNPPTQDVVIPPARGAGAGRRDRRVARPPDGRAVRAGAGTEGRPARPDRRASDRYEPDRNATPWCCRPPTRRGRSTSAVMRLDEAARRLVQAEAQAGTPPPPAATGDAGALAPPILIGQPAPKAKLGEDPAAWARDHWPLLTAIGVVLTSSIVLGVAVSANH